MNFRITTTWLILSASILSVTPALAQQASSRTDLHSTASAVLPVLRLHCLRCHNAKNRDADFDLLNHDALHADPRRLVVSAEDAQRDLAQAKLWRMVGIDKEMPPYDEEPLNESEMALIKTWLLAGAPALAPVSNNNKGSK